MKRFKLNSHPDYGFETGQSFGRQVLLGEQGDVYLAIIFDATGSISSVIERPRGTTWDDANDAELSLKQELQFVEGPIEVAAFSLCDRGRAVGISEMPDDYKAYIEDPSSIDPEDREEYPKRIARWRNRGDFVVYWDEDYWCGPDGIIHTH